VQKAEAREHCTQAPPRYIAASLIKKLEDSGIGRPSTYESIIRKLQDRFVFSKSGSQAMIPTVTGLAAYRLLKHGFSSLVDYKFTSDLEDGLDRIVENAELSQGILQEFYFGRDASTGLQTLVSDAATNINPRTMYALELGMHPELGEPIVVRPGWVRNKRFSPYIECGELRVPIADDTCFEDFTLGVAVELLSKGQPRVLGEMDGMPLYIKVTSTGSYFQLGAKGHLAEGVTKPRTASLLDGMNPDTATATDAALAFSFPRELGVYEPTGEVIFVKLGKFGPYVQAGLDTRSIKDKSAIFELSHEEAIEMLNTPKAVRRGRKKK
jgi:DNA topoisomerase-1